ncbi:hypothetical protein KY290_005219 [Solanum tuberosum]|uniref:Uncharacterized protein n=1 Tax=Solanum tuberosum TaxID=4113 RepID=A0ABQ7WDH3_SOLTU|nr:hypothetical protein KY289_005611 [Solanum tuberosum]KAH0778792.1 hypothetical protein KY290_005219 [Solanum tuberosum]
MAIINKTRPSCTRVKVQVDLLFDFPKFVEVEVRNDDTKESRVEKVNIPYDMLLKYCKHCKVQGHEEEERASNNQNVLWRIKGGERLERHGIPLNRRFTKKANEVMNDKAVTPIKGINSNNIFATLIDIDDGERDAQELDKDKKKLPVEQDKPPGSIGKKA